MHTLNLGNKAYFFRKGGGLVWGWGVECQCNSLTDIEFFLLTQTIRKYALPWVLIGAGKYG